MTRRRLGWAKTWRTVTVYGHPRSVHRPRLAIGTFHEFDGWVALSWGDGSSDDVWCVEWQPEPGGWAWRFFDWTGRVRLRIGGQP